MGQSGKEKLAEQGGQSLSGIEIFRSLPPSDLDELAKRCRWRRYAAGGEVVSHRDESRDVFFIAKGEVHVTICSLAGKQVTFADFGDGEMFGEFAAIDGQPRAASVVALTDSLIASMSADVFWEVLMKYPEASASALKHLTTQFRAATERLFEFSTLVVKDRIHAELLRLARKNMRDDNTAVISPRPTHAVIASRLNASREAVTREFHELYRTGVIERQGSGLVIRDVSRLGQMVQRVLGH